MYFVPQFGHAKVYETSIWTPCFQILTKTMHQPNEVLFQGSTLRAAEDFNFAEGQVKIRVCLSITWQVRFHHVTSEILKHKGNQEIRSNFFFILNTYLRSLEAISRACSGHPKGRLSFGSLSLCKILAMLIAGGLSKYSLNKIKNRP